MVDHTSRKQCSMTRKKSGSRNNKDTEVKDTHEEFEKVFLLIDSH